MINLVYTVYDQPVYPFLTYQTFADGFGFILRNTVLSTFLNYILYISVRKLRAKPKKLD